MKVVNMLKVKEEYDYENQCRKLDGHIDNLTSELERVEKAKEQLERILYERNIALNEAEVKLVDAEKKLAEVENMPIALSEYQMEDSTCHKAFATSEKKVKYLARTLEEERYNYANIEKQLIEVLEHGSRKFSEASRKINLLAELANHHQAVDANPRAQVMAMWFGLFLFALFALNLFY
ncbi:hypothetical protein HPP92_007310 [Vanilla planifolia]|uniref:Uncharacterized protein n=1 Tax=Vanilla planifolia TaxID=51239 RepID=A0A835RM43_VANPL|nr:hypothetical protein HPP92_007514 [Vanilla planifolia]KAG0490447.1 hypothetical protein HPP92_007310 [Vanilla planifolia]